MITKTDEQLAQEMSNEEMARFVDYVGSSFIVGGSYPIHRAKLDEATRRLRAIDTATKSVLTELTAGLDLDLLHKITRERSKSQDYNEFCIFNDLHTLLTRLKAMEARTTT